MSILIKTPKEIKKIRQSCRLAAKCLSYITPYVVAGVTTNELDEKIDKFIKEHKAIPAPLNYHGFPKSTCISLNEVICHGIPSNYQLKNGDILNIDVTTKLNGYFGDTSRMYVVGEIDEATKSLIDVTKQALEVAIKEVRPNAHFGNIGAAIARLVKPLGYSIVTHFCGHGTGIHFHEEPNVIHDGVKNTGPIMKPGMIFTIEPMINQGSPNVLINEADGWTASTVDGKLSAQFEHTILVTNKGYEILTCE